MQKQQVPALMVAIFATLGAAAGYGLGGDGDFYEQLAKPVAWAVLAAVFAGAFVLTRIISAAGKRKGPPADTAAPAITPRFIVVNAAFGFIFMGGLAVVLARAFDLGLLPMIRPHALDILTGTVAALPLCGLLYLVVNARNGALSRFRQKQVDLFTDRNMDLGPAAILFISLGAGITEELLFRGVLLTDFTERFGLPIALAASSLLFGLAHAANLGYFLYTAVMGIYLAALFLWTDNLLTPMVTHAVYDVYALAVTARLVRSNKATRAA